MNMNVHILWHAVSTYAGCCLYATRRRRLRKTRFSERRTKVNHSFLQPLLAWIGWPKKVSDYRVIN